MGRDLAEAFPIARRTFEEADEALGMRLSGLCFEGPGDVLGRTEHQQPAILTASVAALRVLGELASFEPRVVAGHSLGEWSALVAAGVLRFEDAVRGVRERGRLMQAAVPPGVGAMAAVMGLESREVVALCQEVAEGEVLAAANLNGAGQTVVAGHATAVDRLIERAATRQARCTRLDVSAPFHCALMAPAADGVARFLAEVAVGEPRCSVVTSVEARAITGRDEVVPLLVAQVTAPVRWADTMAALRAFEPALAVEVGPGRVLSGLARRIWPELPCHPVGDAAGIAAVAAELA